MSRDRHLIQKQRVKNIYGSEDSYTEWCASHPTKRKKGNLGNRFDVIKEDERANPDSLCDEEASFSNCPSTPQLLIGEAVEHLQGRQKEVYLLTMREGKSLSEAGEVLGISKDTARTYKDRAINFVKKYCHQAIRRGRV